MPAAPDINVRAGGQGPISGLAVELVAVCVQPGIVTAPLLAHEIEQGIGEIAVGPGADGEGQRFRRAEAQHVTPGWRSGLKSRSAWFSNCPQRTPETTWTGPSATFRLSASTTKSGAAVWKTPRQLAASGPAKLVGAEENFSRRGNGRQERRPEHCG